MEELILKEKEFKEKITKLINETELPAFIIKPTIKEIYEQLNNIEQQQYNQALQNKAQKENTDKKIKKGG